MVTPHLIIMHVIIAAMSPLYSKEDVSSPQINALSYIILIFNNRKYTICAWLAARRPSSALNQMSRALRAYMSWRMLDNIMSLSASICKIFQ